MEDNKNQPTSAHQEPVAFPATASYVAEFGVPGWVRPSAAGEMRPFSTYPEDRQKMLALAATIEGKSTLDEDYVKAADELADLVKAILTDEQAVLDAEMFDQMTEEFSETVEQSWQRFKAVIPVAVVINDNQPGNTAIIEILSDPPTLAVGTNLFAAPVRKDRDELISDFKKCLSTMSHSRAGWDYQLPPAQKAKEDRECAEALSRVRSIWSENPDFHEQLRAAFKEASPLATMTEIEQQPA